MMRFILSVNVQAVTLSITSKNWVCYTYIQNVYDHTKWLHSHRQGNPSVESV